MRLFTAWLLLSQLLSCNFGVNSQVPSTGCDVISKGGTCFNYFSTSKVTWNDARIACIAWGGDLATIQSAGDNELVIAITNNIPDCFIGIHDITTEGVYEWADGSDSTYRNWNKGEPNDRSGDEECGQIDNDGAWNDIRCHKNLTCYFCSVKVNPFGIQNNATVFEALSDNSILVANSTLHCLTENKETTNITWSYVDNTGIRSILNSPTDVSTGVSTLSISTDLPGMYSCQVTQDRGTSWTYAVELIDVFSIYTVAVDATNYTYTIGIDSIDRFLFCRKSDTPIQHPGLEWRRAGTVRHSSNPLDVIREGSLLKYTNPNTMECVNTENNILIMSVVLTIQGPPAITLYDGFQQIFSLLPPSLNVAYVTILTDNVVMRTDMDGIWQKPDNSSVIDNMLTFSPFEESHAGLYKFYVTDWSSVHSLAIQIQIIPRAAAATTTTTPTSASAASPTTTVATTTTTATIEYNASSDIRPESIILVCVIVVLLILIVALLVSCIVTICIMKILQDKNNSLSQQRYQQLDTINLTADNVQTPENF